MLSRNSLLVPVLCYVVAASVLCAWTPAAKASTPAGKNAPATVSGDLSNHRPTPISVELPAALRSVFQPQANEAIPVEVRDHRPPGSNTSRDLSRTLNTPSPKPIPAPVRSGSRPSTESGGEDFATATPIPSLPFNDTGNTCSNSDNYAPPCGATGGPDVVYVYTPQVDGCMDVSLCNSNFDTEVYIAVDSSGNIIACDDDFCGTSSRIPHIPVLAGHNYYIIVDGFGSSCGDFVLAVTECPPPPPPVYCPPIAAAEDEPGCGDNYVDDFNGGCNSSPEAFSELPCTTDSVRICGTYGTYLYFGLTYRDTDWYRVTVANTTTLHACVTGQYATNIILIDGRNGCGGAFAINNSSANPGETACLDVTIDAGTYYFVVIPTDYTGIPCGSNYYMTFVADSCPPPPPPPTCPPAAIKEGEPICSDGYVDAYDGGCNSPTLSYVDLACAPGNVNVCGTYGAFLFQGLQYRDTDWYRIVVNRTSLVQQCVLGQYATSIYILDGRSGCNGIFALASGYGGPGQTACCSAYLSPGVYFLFVATAQFAEQPCGGAYVMSVTRDSCPEPFVLSCPPGARLEGEPQCADGYNDHFNAGCNADPPKFSNPYGGGTGNRNCEPGTVRVCGTYGDYSFQGLQYRDTDWYQIVATRTTHLRYCAIGEAATSIFVLNGSSGCGGVYPICGSSGAAGDSICCEVDLSPGTYWLFVATTDYFGVACGSRYVISLTQNGCPEPVYVHCPPGALQESEPACSDLFIDTTNGGCNSTPPLFTPVPCSDNPVQICGTYGTYRYQGIDFRDTDWYSVLLMEPHHVRFCVIGEAPTTIYILDGRGGCAAIGYEATASGAPGDTVCCEADLPAGQHWLFVSPTDFAGVSCGSHYVATISGNGCSAATPVLTDEVRAFSGEGFVEVRWNSSLGSAADFHVLRAPAAEGPYLELSDPIETTGDHEFRVRDHSARPATKYFYRITYAQGGESQVAGSTEVVSSPAELAIRRVRPNPTKGDARIDYELPHGGSVRLEIFDVVGHKVRTLENERAAAAGPASVQWDGRSDHGRELPGGAYFVRLTMDSRVVTHRLTLVK